MKASTASRLAQLVDLVEQAFHRGQAQLVQLRLVDEGPVEMATFWPVVPACCGWA